MATDSKTKGTMLLGSVDLVDLNTTATATTIYTVPTGMKCVLDHVRIRVLSANATSSTVSVGQSGTPTDFLTTQTLSALNAAGATGILRPLPNATTVKGIEYTAGTVLVIKTVAAAGIACTATVEFFGTIDTA
jgi:hypothetical protein